MPKIGSARPYPATGLTTEDWAALAAEVVDWEDVITTQDGVTIEGLLSDSPRLGSDTYPHIVEHAGIRYLEDGHCRVVRSLIRGETQGLARVLRR